MEVIDGNLFCGECSSLVPLSDFEIKCFECGAVFDEIPPMRHETRSKPSLNPAWAKDVEEIKEKKKTLATIEEACPECGNPELEYYTMQLRSADEGQTVFYQCPQCSHKFSVNN